MKKLRQQRRVQFRRLLPVEFPKPSLIPVSSLIASEGVLVCFSFLPKTSLTLDGKVWALLSDPEGQTASEPTHLYPPVQESSYGSPFTPAKRPKRKVTPKRRQERPVTPPKKRRKVHRMDHYAAEARQDKVSLSVVPKLCGGQPWRFPSVPWFENQLSAFQKTFGAPSLALSPEESSTSEVSTRAKHSWTLSQKQTPTYFL